MLSAMVFDSGMLLDGPYRPRRHTRGWALAPAGTLLLLGTLSLGCMTLVLVVF